MTLESLIDKQDNFEIIRDQIASILVLEIAAQKILAIADSQDPLEWDLRVFTERSNPWEQWLNDQTVVSPLINVWYDNSNFDRSASNIMERQKSETIFNIDCYGFGVSETDGGGHKTGDSEAAFEVHKALRLVRNILMSAEYTYLGMRGLVWKRWPQSIISFQPQINDQLVHNIKGARIALSVHFNEFAPQVVPQILDFLSIDVKRTEDNQIVLEADYDYTL